MSATCRSTTRARHAATPSSRSTAGAGGCAISAAATARFSTGNGSPTAAAVADEAVLSIGNTLFLLAANVAAIRGGVAIENGVVVGPRLRATWQAIDLIAQKSKVLHVVGETGTGKEQAARRFHAASKRAAGRFVAVNCAAVPPLLAERLLFGARRGAYSGRGRRRRGLPRRRRRRHAVPRRGRRAVDPTCSPSSCAPSRPASCCRSAPRARASSTSPSARRPTSICVAASPPAAFAATSTSASGSPALTLPPLRARREEIPWIIDVTLGRLSGGVTAHASLVEAALLRPWPGNMRELINAVTAAAHLARGRDNRVMAQHLGDGVGTALGGAVGAEQRRGPDDRDDPATAGRRGGDPHPRGARARARQRHAGGAGARIAPHAAAAPGGAASHRCAAVPSPRRRRARRPRLQRLGRVRVRASLVMIGLAFVACGSGGMATPNNLGTPPSGRDPRCPTTPPANNASCDFGGYGPLSCEYGGDALGRGTTYADCGTPAGATVSDWFVATATIAPNPAACPGSWSEAMQSGSCTSDVNLGCEYDEGRCGCVCSNTTVSWSCRARADVLNDLDSGTCPSKRPLAGDACSNEGALCLTTPSVDNGCSAWARRSCARTATGRSPSTPAPRAAC